MPDLSDDELPDVAVTHLSQSPKKKHVSYHIDLTKEIQSRRLNYEKQQKRLKDDEEEKRRELENAIAFERHQQDVIASLTPIEAIADEAPGREFIKTGSSFCQFNIDNLVKPCVIKQANNKDFLTFFQYLRSTLQEVTRSESVLNESQEVLKYVLFLASVHQDQFIVECCVDLLLEFNGNWEINHKLLLAIFQNWGADINQVLPSYPAVRPLIADRNPKTVPHYNVNAVLQALAAQLKRRKKIDRFDVTNEYGLWNVDELVFGLLILLSLDTKYINCIPVIQECLCRLLTGVSENLDDNWTSEYSESLLFMETDDYNLTSIVCRVLIGSTACERLVLNVSFAAIQRILGIPLHNIQHSFNLNTFRLLINNTSRIAELKPIGIYCLLMFLDTIIRHPLITNEKVLKHFYNWLMRLHAKVGQNSHVVALISNYGILWDDETPAE